MASHSALPSLFVGSIYITFVFVINKN